MATVVVLPVDPLVQGLFAVNCTVALFMLGAVGLRIYSRIYFKAGLGWDDLFIILSVPPALGMLVISGIFGRLFIGHYKSEIPVQNALLVARLMLVYELLYVFTVGTTKLSILTFYLRVFVQRHIRWGAKIGIGILLTGELGMVLQPFLMCHPWQAIYDITIQDAVCGDSHASLIAMGIWAMVTDLAVLALPIKSLWALQMNTRKKVALVVVFSVGLLATIVAIARVYTLAAVYQPDGDSAYTAVWPDFLAVLEPNLNILCISLPMLGTLLRRFSGKEEKSCSSEYTASNLGTYGRSTGGKGFRKMDDSIAMTTIMVKAECKADPVPSESGSEVALSPAGGVENDVGAQVSKVEPVRSGIKIQRTIHVSVSGTS